MKRHLTLGLLIALIATTPVMAETVYVTDQLRLGLYAGEGATGQRLKLLSSGDQLEVVERQSHFARVTTQDGVTGWVKAAFLVDEKPAALIVAETEAARQELQDQIESMRVEYSDVDAVHSRLKESLEQANVTINDLETELADYRGTDRNVVQRLIADPVLLGIFIGAVSLAVLLGALIGNRLYERRMRRRFFGLSLGD